MSSSNPLDPPLPSPPVAFDLMTSTSDRFTIKETADYFLVIDSNTENNKFWDAENECFEHCWSVVEFIPKPTMNGMTSIPSNADALQKAIVSCNKYNEAYKRGEVTPLTA